MFRVLNALVGGFLFFFGTTLVFFGVDGWVPLGIGAGLLVADLFVEHRSWCHSPCETCRDDRAFGTCSSCYRWPVEVGDDGFGCCGSLVILDPADGGPLQIREAA